MDVLAPVRGFDRFQQRHTLLAVPVATIKKFGDDEAGSFAVVVAFYAFFSVFPLLLVFMTVLGYVLAGDQSLMTSVRDSVLGRFPVIGDSVRHDSLKGSALALVAGILLSLYSSLGVTGAITNAFDHVWEIPQPDRENFLLKKLRGMLMIVCLGTLFVIASGASGIASAGLGGGALLHVLGIVFAFLLNLGLFLASFKYLCSDAPGLRSLLPGAAVAAVGWVLLQLGGGAYIDHIKHTSSAYGTFALVLGILAWLHLGAQLTVYCAEFNTVLKDRRWPQSLLGDDQTATQRSAS
jgi:inner membrane protein YhjD